MKKTFFLAIFLLLTLALVTSACKLPAPGGTAPATEPPSGVVEEPTAVPTSGASVEGEIIPTVLPSATPLPPEPTATAVPPTAAPPPTEAVTAVPLPQAQRIQFATGATSSAVNGELAAGVSASYVLTASAGQTMNVQVWSPNSDVYLSVLGADRKLLLDHATRQTQWVGTLNVTQDYYLTVLAGNGAASYSLSVVIPPLSTAVQPTATQVPASGALVFDPYKTFGAPSFEDSMDKNSKLDWALLDGTLPDTKELRLSLDGDKFLVTGKILDYSTWWFNWASLKNFYIEMTVDARTCAGSDAYGFILRGPAHLAGVSYGYIVSFTCDGKLWVYRLDSIKPWSSVDLLSPTLSPHIIQGSNARNVIGIKAIGDTLTIYANGNQVAQLVDKHYLEGRYGLFVRPDINDTYTYEVAKIAYWIFKD